MGDNPLRSGGLVLLEPEVVAVFLRHRQDAPTKLEAGGILLGHRRGPHLHVVEATEPTKHDKRARTRFDRAPTIHRDLALDRWGRSGHIVDYLGEWHTHPEEDPRPSSIDLDAWRAIYGHRSVPMIFIIVGWGHQWLGVGQRANLSRFDVAAISTT